MCDFKRTMHCRIAHQLVTCGATGPYRTGTTGMLFIQVQRQSSSETLSRQVTITTRVSEARKTD